jgi:ssRNA-specific RNase YbeY (16S rRNA maturation enzyme)
LIHGIVHLVGYDHERSAEDARVMKRLERKIHRQLCERGLLKV